MKCSVPSSWSLLVLVIFGAYGVTRTSGQTAEPPAQPMAEADLTELDEQFQDFSKLPPPLDVVTGNVLDMEASGYFKVIKAEYRRTNVHADEALVWTLRVLKPITGRHAILDLTKFHDVRFYRTVTNRLTKQKRQLELITRTLHYSPYLDDAAIELETLDLDESFAVWILLTEDEVISLKNRVADTIKFTRTGPDIRDRFRTMDGEHGNPWAR